MADSSRESPRSLVLCFDGTGNLYNANSTNVVKFFGLLQKDNKSQSIYYQAGVGTYSAPGILAGIGLWIAKILDDAIAWYLDAHVMGGYEFLMQNYCTGDRICLFGFSRGAYTARALAGMLYKVGLLPKDNKEQIGFAYKMYKSTAKNNTKLAAGFKKTFCRSVKVEFLGCWDTVESVGLFWGRHLPFSSSNTSIKRFRHALSLDEHRAKFQPNLWHREAPDESSAEKDPERGSYYPKDLIKKLHNTGKKSSPQTLSATATTSQSSATPTKPPEEPATDVLEVWFAGCHSDIGGGEVPTEAHCSLSNITLRWIVREIIASQCMIQFDDKALLAAGISPTDGTIFAPMEGKIVGRSSDESPTAVAEDARDAVQPIHDQLKLKPLWWILEVIPLAVAWQDNTGSWHRAFRWNLGRGRTIDSPTTPNLHTTVETRMKNMGYVPRATWANKPNVNWVT